MDSTVRTWDIRPFAPTERHIRTFDGTTTGIEKNLLGASWDPEGKKIAAASGDGTVLVWSNDNGRLLYKLPGHRGTVNSAEFSPSKEPICKLNSYASSSSCSEGQWLNITQCSPPPQIATCS
jgi:Prp8 binding protein